MSASFSELVPVVDDVTPADRLRTHWERKIKRGKKIIQNSWIEAGYGEGGTMSLLTNGQTAHSAASDRKHSYHRKEVDSPKGQNGVVLVGFMEYRNKQQRTLYLVDGDPKLAGFVIEPHMPRAVSKERKERKTELEERQLKNTALM